MEKKAKGKAKAKGKTKGKGKAKGAAKPKAKTKATATASSDGAPVLVDIDAPEASHKDEAGFVFLIHVYYASCVSSLHSLVPNYVNNHAAQNEK